MKYVDLRPAIEAYAQGRNVTEFLRQQFGEQTNTSQIIEVAYDLQAGSYIEGVRSAPKYWQEFTYELSQILSRNLVDGDRLLEVGTGEMTTLTGVANFCYQRVQAHYAMDISWSRIRRGRDFVAKEMHPEIAARLEDFVADLFRLPLRDKSVDVVWTCHAIEPNGGREIEAIAELFRVARRRVILFEPSYEENSTSGRARMETLGYIRGLPNAVKNLGGRIDAITAIKAVSNPLNPTYAYVVVPPETTSASPFATEWACPATGLPMVRRESYFWSEGSRLAYPIIDEIPVLRADAAVLATALK
jgi:ubiquinone/menaquinone biosynthesis C-methylase UbiE/uncharacterized protein YbaR (Trm112 family)